MRKTILGAALLYLLSGPAQAALSDYDDLGSIRFPTSGGASAQKHFIHGVLLLHSFEYSDARAAFVRARKAEPDFAMAYWGEAMSHNHPIWNRQDRQAAWAALNRLAPTLEGRLAKAPTPREKDYLKTLEVLFAEGEKLDRDRAYAREMKALSHRYPDDGEAASFYALSILGTAQGNRDFRIYMRAAAVVEEVFGKNARHPGAAHYLIHSYDDPIHAALGLRAARVYAGIAPEAPHALHMPSHVFMALGMWDKSNSSNEASAAAAHKKKQPPHHAEWWLSYGYLQQGRYREASALVERMAGRVSRDPSGRSLRHLAYMASSFAVEAHRWNSTALRDVKIDGLGLQQAGSVYLARGLAAIERSDLSQARKWMKELSELSIPAGRDSHRESTEIMRMELSALLHLASGDADKSVQILEEATALQDRMSFEFGPPLPVKPVHELFGEVLLKLGRLEEARREFEEALSRNPRRSLSLLGLARAAKALGDLAAGEKAYAELKEVLHRSDASPARWEEVILGSGR